MLSRLPTGSLVFLDANIFLYPLLGANPSCTELFLRIKRRDVRGITSTAVLSEVLHHVMLAEIGERHPVTVGGALRLLRRHPEMIATLSKAQTLIHEIPTWRVRIVPLRWAEMKLATELSRHYHLLTTDAVIIATMRRHRVSHLISNDSDFARIPGVTLWRP